jgi:hypothetical protein
MPVEEIVLSVAVVGVVVLAGLVTWAVRRGRTARREMLEAWEAFARENGLAYRAPRTVAEHPRVEGVLRGRPFSMERKQVSSGEDSRVATFVELAVRGLPDGLRLLPRATTRVGRALLGATVSLLERLDCGLPPELELGQPELEANWSVRGFDADGSRRWASSLARRNALVALAEEDDLVTRRDRVVWEGRTPRALDEIRTVVARLEDHARALEAP